MIVRVPIEKIRENPYQTRQNIEEPVDIMESLQEMRAALPETSGLIQVPVGRLKSGDGQVNFVSEPEELVQAIAKDGAAVELAAGHRRYEAFCRLAAEDREYTTFPVNVTPLSDGEMATLAWEENAKRQDINPVDKALALKRAMEEFNWTQEQLGARWGLSQSAVANKLRLLQLPDEIQALLRKGEITGRHGRALLPLMAIGHADAMVRVLGSRGPDGYEKTTARLASDVRAYIERNTKLLDGAGWDFDWLPEMAPKVPGNGVMTRCSGCQFRAKVYGSHRCGWLTCFNLKSKTFREQVKGPAHAETMYHNHAHWTVGTLDYGMCATCRRSQEKAKWYQHSPALMICEECWRRAGLPEPEPEPEPQQEIASAPVAEAPLTREEHRARYGIRGQADANPDAPPLPPQVAKKPPIPAPEPKPAAIPPATVLTARIMSGSNGVESRRVLVSIGEEGSGPAVFRSGTFGDIGELIGEVLREHLGDELLEVNNGDVV